MAILYTFPYTSNGVTLGPIGGTAQTGTATLTAAIEPLIRSVPHNVQIPITGTWMYPAVIVDSTLATTAVSVTLYGSTTAYTLGSIVNFPDGRNHLEFYVDQATWALYPIILGNIWLEWVSNGLFVGLRRIELNPQNDDIFMATGIWDINVLDESETNLYRLTPNDLQSLVDWQVAFNARLPAGSNVVLSMPFNGATVIEDGGYNVDPLFLKAKLVRDNFFWESHTWDHPYLDNLTYNEVMSEFTQNNAAALVLFANNLANPHFCSKSVITPSISGLFNPNALKAMYDFGIRNVVGDNSRPELLPSNVYHGFYTTQAVNGFDGIYVVPRHATNIYYDAQLPADLMSQYNYRYNSYWGRDLTFDEMIAEQVSEHAKLLLAYRQDPFMFHQANLGFFAYNGKQTTLVTHWADVLADTIMSYSTLPIKSHSHDDVAQIFKDRESRDACGFTGTVKVDSATLAYSELTATTTGTCKLAITGATAPTSAKVSLETYGPDNTLWLQMTPNTPVEVIFSSPIPRL